MESKIFIANWKMNLRLSEQKALLTAIVTHCTFPNQLEVVVCPSYTNIPAVAEVTNQLPLILGAQDVSAYPEGAYTGEVSTAMLHDYNAEYCIVGHSERRKLLAETDAVVRDKAWACLASGIIPIICVGETLDQRQQGQQDAIVSTQIQAALQGINLRNSDTFVIAYEPLWAIGTGQAVGVSDAKHMAQVIRQVLIDFFHETNITPEHQPRIVYGGSVNPDNITDFSANGFDGVLVGGASLHADQFCHMIEALINQ